MVAAINGLKSPLIFLNFDFELSDNFFHSVQNELKYGKNQIQTISKDIKLFKDNIGS